MTNYTLKQTLEIVLRKVYSKKGPLFAELMLNWTTIVGSEMSDKIEPFSLRYYVANGEKISNLVLKLSRDANSLEVQFAKMTILERINNYFGYRAISELCIKNHS